MPKRKPEKQTTKFIPGQQPGVDCCNCGTIIQPGARYYILTRATAGHTPMPFVSNVRVFCEKCADKLFFNCHPKGANK